MMDELYRGIVNIDVNDNNAIAQVAGIVERVKAEFAKLAGIPTAAVGPNLTGPLGSTRGDVEHQIAKMRELSAEYQKMAQAQGGGKLTGNAREELRQLEQLSRGLDQLERKYREVAAARARGSAYDQVMLGGQDREENRLRQLMSQPGTASTFSNEDYYRRRLGLEGTDDFSSPGYRYRPSSAEQLDMEMGAPRTRYAPVPDATAMAFSPLDQEMARATKAFTMAHQGLDASYKTLKQKDAAELQYITASKALTNASLKLAARQDIESKAMLNVKDPRWGTLRQPGDEFLKDRGLNPAAMSPTRMQFEDRLNKNLARQAEIAEMNIGSMTVEQQAQANATRLQQERATLLVQEKVLRERIAGLAAKEQANALRQTDIDRKAAANAKAPIWGQLGMSSEDYLAAQGLDPKGDVTRTKVQSDLAATQAKIRDLAGLNVTNMTREELAAQSTAKLTEQKRTLALKEVQLKAQLVGLAEKERLAARGDGGMMGGFFGRNKGDDGFGEGFAHQAGVTLKYFALYSAFAGIQQALVQIKEDTERYTKAVTDLSIAMDSSYASAESVVKQFEAIGMQVGQGPIDTAENLAQAARVWGPTEDAFRTGARTFGMLDTLEPDSRDKNATQDLIAVLKSYSVPEGGAEYALDQIFKVARHYGYATPGEVLPGVSAIADIGKEAGYTIPELTALISGVMREQGVGGDAAAGDIKRFLGSQSDPGLVSMFGRAGIDPDLPFKEKLDQFFDWVQQFDPEERSQIISRMANPRIAAAVTPAIFGIPEAREAAAAAAGDDAVGATADAVSKHLVNLRGQLQLFSKELEELFNEMSKTGLFDMLLLVVRAGRSFVDVLGQMLESLNSVPTIIKQITGSVLLLMAANKASAVLSAGAGLADKGLLSRLAPTGESMFGATAKRAQVENGLAQAMGGTTAATTRAAAASTGLTTRLGAMAGAMGGAVVGAAKLAVALLPLIAIAAGVTVISDAKTMEEQQRAAGDETVAAYKNYQEAKRAGDPEALKTAQERLKRTIPELEKGDDGFTGWLMNTLTPGLDDARQEVIDKVNALIDESQKEIDAALAAEAKLNAQAPTSEWFGKNYNNIDRGMKLLTSKGVGPDTVLPAIEDLLRQNAGVVQAALQPGEGLEGIPQKIAETLTDIGRTPDSGQQVAWLTDTARILREGRERLQGRLATEAADLAELAELAERNGKPMVNRYPLVIDPVPVDTGPAQAKVAQTESEILALETLEREVAKAQMAAVLSTTRKRVDLLKKNYTGADDHAEIRAALADAMIAAAEGGDIDALTELMSTADKTFNESFLQQLRTRREALAIMEESLQKQVAALEEALASQPDAGLAGDILPNLRQKLGETGASRAGIDAQIKAAEEAIKQARPDGSATKAPQVELDIAKRMESALIGDPLAQATAQLDTANMRLDLAVPNTAAYYDALRAIHEAEQALADVEFNAAQAELNAGVEVGNSIAAAKRVVDAALAARDRAPVDSAEYWAAQKQYDQAKYDLARLEMTQAQAQAGAGLRAGDSLAAARQAVEDAKDLVDFTSDPIEYWNAKRQLNQAQYDLAQLELNTALAQRNATLQPGNTLQAARFAVTQAAAQMRATADPLTYWQMKKQFDQAKYDLAKMELNISIAQRSAGIAAASPLAEARASVDAARRQLAFTKDPLEYWTSLKALNQAKYDLARIELEMASSREMLRIDITDPVAQANAQVREAQRQLAFDRNRGASDDVILADQVALRQAQSDAQGTAWQQEFSDQRTNYDLQRTSLSAYLSYLRAQHEYLSAVKNKTRQQVEQLNQVDQALKGLTEGLQGQWNLGEIKVPTPYEMRRSLAGGGFTTGSVSYVNISLTAASDADLRRVLETYVGTPVMQTVATSPAKV